MKVKIKISTKEVRRMFFGSYSDGRVRSMKDAYHDEYLSPKQKKKAMKAKNKPKTKFKLQ